LPAVQCALCREMYTLPSMGVMVAAVSDTGDSVEFWRSEYGAEPGLVAYYSLEVPARSFWRCLGDAWRGFVAGWRGEP